MLQEIVIKLELDSTSSTGVRLCLGEISSEELYRVCREAAHVHTSVCTVAGQRLRARPLSPQPTCARHSGSREPNPQGSGWDPGKRWGTSLLPGLGSGVFPRTSLYCHEKARDGRGTARALK